MMAETNPTRTTKLRSSFWVQFFGTVFVCIVLGGVAGWHINNLVHPHQVGPVEGTLSAHLEPEAIDLMVQVAKEVKNTVVVVLTSKADPHQVEGTQFAGHDCFLASLRLIDGNQKIIGQWCESVKALSLAEGQVSGYGFNQVE